MPEGETVPSWSSKRLKRPSGPRGRLVARRAKERKRERRPLDAKAVGLRIRTLLPTLTALEARVVSGLISQGAIDEKTLLKWVASGTGVSEAMIVKIAKKLGFNGFRSRGSVWN
jgi:hypothetical protein